jgi:hypothetical protein
MFCYFTLNNWYFNKRKKHLLLILKLTLLSEELQIDVALMSVKLLAL